MGLIAMPGSVRIRHIEWSLDRPAQVNRSPYTGARKVVANPWHGMWRARVDLAPIVGEGNVRAWRAFLGKLKGQINSFYLPATEGPQHLLGSQTASAGAAQGATSITLANSSTYGPELLTNGTFDTNTSGWTDSGTSSSWISPGQMRVTMTGASGATFASGAISVSAGDQFRVKGTLNASHTNFGRIRLIGGSNLFVLPLSSYPSGNIDAVVTATASWVGYNFEVSPATSAAYGSVGDYVDADNCSLKKITGSTAPTLTAGMLATVMLPSGNAQLVQITAVAGNTINFEPPLREAISSGAVVETASPFAQVALADSLIGWSVDPGTQYGIGFDAEEVF